VRLEDHGPASDPANILIISLNGGFVYINFFFMCKELSSEDCYLILYSIYAG